MDQLKYIRARDKRWAHEDIKRDAFRKYQSEHVSAEELDRLRAIWTRSDTARIAYRVEKRKEAPSKDVSEIAKRHKKEDDRLAKARLKEDNLKARKRKAQDDRIAKKRLEQDSCVSSDRAKQDEEIAARRLREAMRQGVGTGC